VNSPARLDLFAVGCDAYRSVTRPLRRWEYLSRLLESK